MPNAKYRSPLGYAATLIILTAIFAEGTGMLILHHTGSPHSALVYLDSILIVVLLLPAVYFVVYRPMSTFIKEILQVNSEKERALERLQNAMQEIKVLKGIIPICAKCKKIRDDQGYWRQIEQYISEHSEAHFSHGLCQECANLLYPELFSDGKNV
jgi:hypothetical protein